MKESSPVVKFKKGDLVVWSDGFKNTQSHWVEEHGDGPFVVSKVNGQTWIFLEEIGMIRPFGSSDIELYEQDGTSSLQTIRPRWREDARIMSAVLRHAADRIDAEDRPVLGVAVAVAFSGGQIGTEYALVALQNRILGEMK
jgi:hypothetical protein